ncbi:hypothetical protein ACPC5U_13025 [Acinetobacter haemolyticus]|uniref:hypothetical protein n=1 Tax=Acinetobacter haemolyticus TaxID=29430 RepID=UPI003C22E649
MMKEFTTITGNVVEVETQIEGPCRHKYIQSMPMQFDEMESKYQCYHCGMLFSAMEMHAIKFGHQVNSKPLSREEFDELLN